MKFLSAIFLTFAIYAAVNAAMVKNTRMILLGESEIKINVYENAGAHITFFAPHFNEHISRNLAREYVARSGGRLVEIESYDEQGNASRYVRFNKNGKIHIFDPNRIYTENGRSCANYAPDAAPLIKDFAGEILRLLFDSDGKTLRDKENFIVAVHNNVDVDTKNETVKFKDLTAVSFLRAQSSQINPHGAFEAQAEGVYLSNTETDADNFVFLSMPRYVGYFAELGFNVVVQKNAAKLRTAQCGIDDGSLSVYAALNAVSYICLEADGVGGGYRQRRMFEAVYALAGNPDILKNNFENAAR